MYIYIYILPSTSGYIGTPYPVLHGAGLKQYMHTTLRNVVYSLAIQAAIQPQLES